MLGVVAIVRKLFDLHADRHNLLAEHNLRGVIPESSSHQTKCHRLIESATDETTPAEATPPGSNPELFRPFECGGESARVSKRKLADYPRLPLKWGDVAQLAL
jgi:hypothetical protein